MLCWNEPEYKLWTIETRASLQCAGDSGTPSHVKRTTSEVKKKKMKQNKTTKNNNPEMYFTFL